MKFQWDERKNLSNIKKHGISFEEAAYVFSDIDMISLFDEEHSDTEERWISIGKIKNHGIIVVYTLLVKIGNTGKQIVFRYSAY